MHAQTFAVLRATPRPLLSRAMSRHNAPLKLAYLLDYTSNWGHLEHFRFLTPWATYSLWPCPHDSSPHGWEACPTPGALTYIKITWAFPPSAPHVPGVNPGYPSCPWCFGHSLWRGAQQILVNLCVFPFCMSEVLLFEYSCEAFYC